MINKILECKDLWQTLLQTHKKILLYGMGDGADKVLDVCQNKGITVSGVFASDGFSKNKVFRGFDVTDYTTAKQIHGDFIVLMSFASSRDDVIQNVHRIACENELYCPDVPVFGEGLFDSEFVRSNFDKFKAVYEMLSDELSKKNYVNLILGKLTGDIKYLQSAETTIDEAYKTIIKPEKNSCYVDIGAYNGDTIREYLSYSGSCSKIYAFEPDVKNYKKLCSYATEQGIEKTYFYNIAAWDKQEILTFYSRSGRNSAGTTSHKNVKSIEIQADKCDRYIKDSVDFINIDAEGSDKRVLLGLNDTIQKYKPTLSCALYHRNEDFFELPLLLKSLYSDCEMFIRHFKYYPAWDTNVYVRRVDN